VLWPSRQTGGQSRRQVSVRGITFDSGTFLQDGCWSSSKDTLTGSVQSAFSADGRVLASAGSDWTIRTWNAATGEQLRVLNVHGNTVRQIAFQPRGEVLASAGNDMTVRLWNAGTGEALAVWRGTTKIAALAFAPDGLSLASGDTNGVVLIRDLTTGDPIHTFHSDDAELTCLAFAPDGRTLASAALGRVIHLWDPMTALELRR